MRWKILLLHDQLRWALLGIAVMHSLYPARPFSDACIAGQVPVEVTWTNDLITYTAQSTKCSANRHTDLQKITGVVSTNFQP